MLLHISNYIYKRIQTQAIKADNSSELYQNCRLSVKHTCSNVYHSTGGKLFIHRMNSCISFVCRYHSVRGDLSLSYL